MDQDELKDAFENAYYEVTKRSPKKGGIKAEFYPYAGIKETIRKRNNTIIARVSDIFQDAPYNVIWAIAIVMVSKIERKRYSNEYNRIIRDYINTDKIREKHKRIRKTRGRKKRLITKGDHYDLNMSFDRVNSKYFDNQLKKPGITWGRQRTYNKFGHYDETRNTVMISKTLDSKKIPPYFLDFIMYHELLHTIQKIVYKNGRRSVHNKWFKKEEQKHEKYNKATNLMKKISIQKKVT